MDDSRRVRRLRQDCSARAHRRQRLLENGECGSITELAAPRNRPVLSLPHAAAEAEAEAEAEAPELVEAIRGPAV